MGQLMLSLFFWLENCLHLQRQHSYCQAGVGLLTSTERSVGSERDWIIFFSFLCRPLCKGFYMAFSPGPYRDYSVY